MIELVYNMAPAAQTPYVNNVHMRICIEKRVALSSGKEARRRIFLKHIEVKDIYIAPRDTFFILLSPIKKNILFQMA